MLQSRSVISVGSGVLLLSLGLLYAAVETARAVQNGPIAFTSFRDGNGEIYKMDADGSNQTRLTNDPNSDDTPRWSPDRQSIAWSRNFAFGDDDIYTMNADGSNQVNRTSTPGYSDRLPRWSPDGQKILFQSDRDGDFELYTMNADGSNVVQLTNNTARDTFGLWSPDGSKVAFVSSRANADGDIFVMDADGSNQTNLTNDAAVDFSARWSPDGSKLQWRSRATGNFDVWVMNADGTGKLNLTNAPGSDLDSRWSPDGSRISFDSNRGGNDDVYAIDPDGSNETRLTTDPARDGDSEWSPDGQKLIFRSNRDGNGGDELYTVDADGSNPTRLTFTNGAESSPHWSGIQPPADTTGPEVTINLVDGSVVEKDAVVNVFYDCDDSATGGSGIQSCIGTVPDGALLDTSTVGSHSFTVTGTDGAGNVTEVTRNYTVNAPPSSGGSGGDPVEYQVIGALIVITDPIATATDDLGNTYVLHSTNAFVTKLDLLGNVVTAFGTQGAGAGELDQPTDIVVEGDSVFVSEAGNSRISEFSTSGAFRAHLGATTIGEPVVALAIRPLAQQTAFSLLALTAANTWVVELDPATDMVLSEFGTADPGLGQLLEPVAIAASADGRAYVVDAMLDKVVVFDLATGDVEFEFGQSGSQAGEFNDPRDIIVSEVGNVFVADAGNDRIQQFDADGAFLAVIGVDENGESTLEAPNNLSVDRWGNLLVGDVASGQVFQFGASGFNFAGFFNPVKALPTLNHVKAGKAIPVKFSLNGDQGLDVIADTYPRSEEIICSSSVEVDVIEETVTAGNSSLQYDAAEDEYTYVWKTSKAWENTCRQLVVRLADGSSHRANFKFK